MKKFLLFITVVLFSTHSSFATTFNVGITNNVFTPAIQNIQVGDTVVWNCTQGFHSVLADDNSFTSGAGASAPWTYSHVFTSSGSNPYHCGVHGFGMAGVINVAAAPPGQGPCLDLFISEYIEGSSQNKAIEIYNPTNATVDLTDYKISIYFNGSSSAGFNASLSGSLAPGDVFVFCQASADPLILAQADLTTAAALFNGNDAVALSLSGTNIDVIGVIGIDPGTVWPVGLGATSEFTLVRKISVNKGETNWTIADDQYDVYPQNDFTHVGAHTMTACAPGIGPTITMVSSDGLYGEAIGTLCPNVGIINPASTSTTVDVVVSGGSATSGTDFTFTTPVVFPPNYTGNINFCITIINDLIFEPIEDVTFALANPNNNATIVDSFFTVTIYDNDSISTDNECGDLFFSEYVHTYSNDQAIEIFNPNSNPADLTEYELRIYLDGASSPTNTISLAGPLSQNEVYVVANPNADLAVLAVADLTSISCNWGGDDAIGLFHNNVLIDVIGDIGVDPGLYWPAGNGAITAGQTLVRNPVIRQGETSWNISGAHWTGFSLNDFTHLGAHTMVSCGFVPPAEITIVTSDATHMEDVGSICISVAISNPDSLSHTVDVLLGIPSTATQGVDFTYSPATLTFVADSAYTQYVCINIIDDLLVELDETVTLKISNPTNNAIIIDSLFTETIMDNDVGTIPTYTIGQVTDDINLSCFSDSVGVSCTLNGVVHGLNYSTTGLRFYMIDNTGGISVFNSANPPGYVVTEGDDIDVTGIIQQFMGQTEIAVDTIIVNSTGNPLVAPDTITVLDETTESEHIVFADAWIVNTAQWTTSVGPGFTVDFTNGTQTIAVRIDNQMPFYSMPAITDTVNIRGVGSQFDNNTDCAGYQLYPFAFDSIPEDSVILVEDIFNSVGLQLYPNPANEIVIVSISQMVDAIVLSDMLGRELIRIDHPVNKQNIFDLENIPAGMYLIRAEKNGIQVAEKLIRQ